MQKIKKILEDLQKKKITIEDALEKLKILPFKDLDFARLDTHRSLRKNLPEIIYCEGKTPSQVLELVKNLKEENEEVILTRVSRETAILIKKNFPSSKFYEEAKILTLGVRKRRKRGKVLVITAGTSDIPVAEEAVIIAELMGANVEKLYDVGVAGVHRIMGEIERLLSANVIVVVAGMEGALPSLVAGLVDKPIIAVPTSIGYGASFKGLAALLGMLNSCAPGVAVVNIDNGFGAGAFAAMINRA